MFNRHKLFLFVITLLLAGCGPASAPAGTPEPAELKIPTTGHGTLKPSFVLARASPIGEVVRKFPVPADGKLVVNTNEVLVLTMPITDETGANVLMAFFRAPEGATNQIKFTVHSKNGHPWTVHEVKFVAWPDEIEVVEFSNDLLAKMTDTGVLGCLTDKCEISTNLLFDVTNSDEFTIP